MLAAERTYTPDNHGLFVDLGLARLTRFRRSSSRRRAGGPWPASGSSATLRKRLSQGVWLEHSSAYQFLAIRPLDSMLNVLGSDAELAALRDEMRAAGRLVRPARRRADAVRRLEPRAGARLGARSGARDAGVLRRRLRLRARAGRRRRAGYLAVTDGFHNTTHKHADELSFELFDHGVPIVNDTGLYHKDPGEIRDYVVSNRAHSGLAVDGLDLPIADGGLAYGSGLIAAGEGDGWYAIEGRNRLLEPQGVAHSGCSSTGRAPRW